MIDNPKNIDQNKDDQEVQTNDQGSAGGESTRDYRTPDQEMDIDDDTDLEE